MTTEPLPAIEPVTDEDVDEAIELITDGAWIQPPVLIRLLEQDRRRVAERQANHGTTHAEGCVSWGRGHYECAMVEIEHLRAEVARIEGLRVAAMEHLADYDVTVGKLQAEVATLRAERNTALRQLATHIDRSADDETVLRAEVARLSAACAAKDEALRLLTDMDELRETDELYIARAALSDTAGKGWIDASGAVEAVAHRSRPANVRVVQNVPDDWAGSRVLIVRKP